MNTMAGTVFIVDDDIAVRESLALLCETAGLPARAFACAEDFLQSCSQESEGCLILDLRMPGGDGTHLQETLTKQKICLPVIFLTAYGDIPTTARAMKAGAMDFLTKPVDGILLMERIRAALRQSAKQRLTAAELKSILDSVEHLTEREREVMSLAANGQPNKAIARHLGISHRTVETHRAHVMKKVGAANLLDLARIAEVAGLQGRSRQPALRASTPTGRQPATRRHRNGS